MAPPLVLTILLASVLLAVYHHPAWLWLTGLMRVNLIQSAFVPLGLFAGSRKVGGKVLRAYELTPERLADLRARYAPPSATPADTE